jgi:hypothetical protein
LSAQFSSTTAGVVASGSSSVSITVSASWASSQLTDPSHLGPGKGDLIIGEVYNLTWDVWLVIISLPSRWYWLYNLVSSQRIGDFYNSRQDLASSGTHVEDKTGQVGAYRNFEDISAGYPIEKSVTYSWSGSITTGYAFDLKHTGYVDGQTQLYDNVDRNADIHGHESLL